MKKLMILATLMVFMVGFNNISVSAEKQHKHDSVGMEQAFDQFILSQFNDEINEAVKKFYKNESVNIQYDWWAEKYDVVEIDQSEKGNELSHPYVMKFTILTYDDKKQLGTDTIIFGVAPAMFNKEFNEKNLVVSKVELLNYKHSEPSNDKKN